MSKFVAFVEITSEKKCFLTFLEYMGNEKALTHLKNLTEYANYSQMFGEFSKYEINMENILSETTVREMLMINTANFDISLCIGHFDFPEDEFFYCDEFDTALKLDDLLCYNQIKQYFQ
jgi:hypothetical protein